MFKPKLPQQEQGFTLIMVLAAILIALLSVTFAMQMLAIAALFKARAQGYAEATTWIQADLENVKAQAANFQDTSLTVAASSTDTVLHVASVDGFQDGDTLIVGTNSTNSIKIKTGGVDFMGKTITLNTSLGGSNTWPIGTTVLATTRCKSSVLMSDATLGTSLINVAATGNFTVNDILKLGSDPSNYTISGISGTALNITPNLGTNQSQGAAVVATTPNTGFAAGFQTEINPTNPSSIPENSKFTHQAFILKRTTTISSNAPYSVLQISYDVSPTSGGASIASFYTEVIPNAALQCP